MDDISVLIVDDEPLARTRLRRLLLQLGGSKVVGECSSGREVGDAIRALSPQAILMDITMPGMDGFEALQRAGLALPAVVFVTAHADFAAKAFSIDAVDYLLKPVSVARLGEALRKIRRAITVSAPAPPPDLERITLTQKGRTTVIELEHVETIVANSNYICLHDGTREIEVRGSLAKLELQLDSNKFIRVHRSILVRVSAVRDITALHSGRYLLTLRNGRTVPTGRSYKDIVQRSFKLKAFG
jgi:two-component system, LytTR family, response regulator